MGVSIPPKYVVGYKYVNKQGYDVEVVEYRGRKDITVKFLNDGATKVTTGSYIKELLPLHPTEGKYHVGMQFPCADGDTVEIVELLPNCHARVKWLSDGSERVKSMGSLKSGFNRHPTKNVPCTGDVYKTNNSGDVKVITFKNAMDVIVEFTDGQRVNCSVADLNRGCVRHPRSNLTVGEKYKTNSGWEMEVIEYTSPYKVLVKWQDGSTSYEKAAAVKTGSIKPLMQPSAEGVGYFGVGRFVPRSYKEGEYADERVHGFWQRMICRCYSPLEMNKVGGQQYRDVHVSENWRNFQNFAEWAYDQVGVFSENFQLDKDILVKGNKVYSADACCFLPPEVNAFVSERKSGNFPPGVNVIRGKQATYKTGYTAKINRRGVRDYLGFYDTPELAFSVYKTAKESYAKELAEKWKDQIDPRAYDALMNYTVEITD